MTSKIHNNGNFNIDNIFYSKMLSIFGVTVVMYFIEILSGFRKYKRNLVLLYTRHFLISDYNKTF